MWENTNENRSDGLQSKLEARKTHKEVGNYIRGIYITGSNIPAYWEEMWNSG